MGTKPMLAGDRLMVDAASDMASELIRLEIELESFIECGGRPSHDWVRENLSRIRVVLDKAT
jgi:hypothetical protein